MTAEEAAAAVARHESYTAFLREIGQALEAESVRRRAVGEAALTNETAAVFIAGQRK